MKCRHHERDDPQMDLFKVELAALLNLDHPMVRLADKFDWDQFKQSLEAIFRSLRNVSSQQLWKRRMFSPVDERPLTERFDKTVGY